MKIVVSSLINSDTMLQNRQWCITVNNANGFCIFQMRLIQVSEPEKYGTIK